MPLKTKMSLGWKRVAQKWHCMYTSNVMALDLTQNNGNTDNGNIVTFFCVTLF